MDNIRYASIRLAILEDLNINLSIPVVLVVRKMGEIKHGEGEVLSSSKQ